MDGGRGVFSRSSESEKELVLVCRGRNDERERRLETDSLTSLMPASTLVVDSGCSPFVSGKCFGERWHIVGKFSQGKNGFSEPL